MNRRRVLVAGLGDTGLLTATPGGRSFRIPAWSLLQPLIVRRGIYGGVRKATNRMIY
ncbi:hypothetical protein ACIP5Y_28450 [Nocardia sp. NPDC088792]|uniref:hypothetical protein n=1 Tax=Nocardia sp. NPDC088792 TaxID=3364332 RepID=UPI003826A5E9